jgi:outer membrane biosynthesis protein TonB
MEFVLLESRGGNYLVVAQNIAWLRTAENGQTSVGMVGGQPLLVVGSIQEVAEKVLASAAQRKEPGAEAEGAALTAAAPVEAPAPVVAEPVTEQAAPVQPAERPAVLPEEAPVQAEPPIAAELPEPVVAEAPAPARPPAPKPASAPPVRVAARSSASLWERQTTAANGLTVKAGSQRMMGRLE